LKDRPILLDTCAALWIADEGRLRPEAEAELQAAQDGGVPIFLSAITAWEVGQLVARGRVALALPPLAWFQAFKEAGFGLVELTAEILIDSSFLPGPPLRDPADRIIAATARARGYRVMTRDRPILELAAAGHINAIAC
jgi:PIN domain nuclease of toxin-antitoxin system